MERMDTVPEICVIAPTETLAAVALKAAEELNEKIGVYVAALEDAAALAQELLAQGARVFISRRGTRMLLEKSTRATVVDIQSSLADYVKPLERLRGVKGKIGFLSYGDTSPDVLTLCHMLNMNVSTYTFTSSEDSLACVRRAIQDGVAAAIGGITTAPHARDLGLEHITLENSEGAVILAIRSAKQILAIQKQEAKKQEELSVRLERYELIFNYTHDAIIAIDAQGRITAMNLAAERIVNMGDRHKFAGRPLDEVLKNTRMMTVLRTGEPDLDSLMNINGTIVSTNRVPIIVDNTVHGVVATFQNVERIRESEQKIRITMHKKGLVAKHSFPDILGSSPAIQAVKRQAESYAKTDSTVFIHGETGTGKELFAQSIHNASRRRNTQFVAINCAALPQSLLEAELFGYESGAFTGASKGGKMGLFEVAHGGTIFLDEIGELAVETQVQLLRVLQEREIRRIGSDQITPVDIRVITATNRDLKAAVAEGTFREDLYYRLNVLTLSIPPLRERAEDIPELGRALFLQRGGPASQARLGEFLSLLRQTAGYPWRGNVRELRNFVERVGALMDVGAEPEQFDQLLVDYAPDSPSRPHRPGGEQDGVRLDGWEKEKIVGALKENGLSMTKTAAALGIGRSTLWRKMKQYGIRI